MVFRKAGVILFFFLLIISSCATTQPRTDSAASLKERANTYWQAKIKGDLEKTYLLETPDFRKRTRLLDYFKAYSGGFLFQEARIKSVTIDGSSGKVDLVIRTHLLGIRLPKEGITRPLTDYWKLVNGHWYHTTSPLPDK